MHTEYISKDMVNRRRCLMEDQQERRKKKKKKEKKKKRKKMVRGESTEQTPRTVSGEVELKINKYINTQKKHNGPY